MNISKVSFLLISFLALASCHQDDKPTLAISSFTPAAGPEGTTVTISGTNFSSTAANNTVTFNGTNAVVTSASPTQLVTTVPAGATSGKISVSVSGSLVSSQTDFTVSQGITSFAPANGPEGTTVIITGTSFSTTPSDNIVKFNGVAATVTAATSTQLTTTVPTGATTGAISITLAGTTVSSAGNFSVSHCLIASIVEVSTGFSDDDQNRTFTDTYSYDANNNLIKDVQDNGEIQYTYTNGLITKVINTGDGSQETWTYNDAKLVKHIDGVFTGSTDNYANNFTYDASGKLISADLIEDGDLSYTSTFTYSGANVTSVVGKNGADVVFSISYSSYDSKYNPALLLAKAMGNQVAYINEGVVGASVSKNNALAGNDTDVGPNTAVYEYNTNGYPTKITFTYTNGGKTIVTLTYTNCN